LWSWISYTSYTVGWVKSNAFASQRDALRVARRFNAGIELESVFVPAGRLKTWHLFHQPSLWDEALLHANPALKRRATFGLSLWDNKTYRIV